MNTMVEAVVRVLDRQCRNNHVSNTFTHEDTIYRLDTSRRGPRDEDSVYNHPNRILKSRVPKRTPRRKPIRTQGPSNTTGEYDTWSKTKEHLREQVKHSHPTDSLKWAKNRWVVRQEQKEEIIEKYQLHQLNEISWRTIGIGATLAKVKQYANKVDSGIQKLKSLSSSLQRAKDDDERWKILGDIQTVDSEVSSAMRSMIMYGALVSATGALGTDRAYKLLKKLQKKRR